MRVMRNGGWRDVLAINPQTASRMCAYLNLVGSGADINSPTNSTAETQRQAGPRTPAYGPRRDRPRSPTTRWRARARSRLLGALSMRATFIITVLEDGSQLEYVQKAADHRDP